MDKARERHWVIPGSTAEDRSLKVRDYPGLDLVRLAAAVLVTLYHLLYWWWIPSQLDRPDLLTATDRNPLIASGWVGVPIFFMLSGFVIAFTADGRSAEVFLRNRALRLYPAALLCATITLLVAGGDLWAYLSSVLLLPSGHWLSGVYWTLPIEISFYLVVAICLRARISLPHFSLALGFMSGSYWFLRTVDGLIGKPIRPFFELIESAPWGAYTLLTYGCHFAIGMGLWAFATGRASRLHLPMLVQCFWAGLMGLVANAHAYSSANRLEVSAIWPVGMWLIALGLIVAAVLWNEPLVRLVGARRTVLRWAGLATYPLYLVHSEIGRDIILKSAPALGTAPALALGLLGVGLLAATLAWLEARLRGLVEQRLRRPAPAAAVPDLP